MFEQRYRHLSSNAVDTFRAMLSTPFEHGCRHLSSRADGIICFYRFNLVRRPRLAEKTLSYSVNLVYCQLQVCGTQTCVKWDFRNEEETSEKQLQQFSLGGREHTLEDSTESPPTRVCCANAHKNIGLKHPLRRPIRDSKGQRRQKGCDIP